MSDHIRPTINPKTCQGWTAMPRPTITDGADAPGERAFHDAIREYQSKTGRKFPTWAEVLSEVKEKGYARTI